MSAFVVDLNTINRCVGALTFRGQYGWSLDKFAGFDVSEPANRTKIGRLLYTLNIEAVTQRYPDCEDHPENLPGPVDDDGNSTVLESARTYRYRAPAANESLVSQIKALRCLSYQCCEGDVMKHALYRELNKAIGELCEYVVARLPEYEAAPWG